jgi:hypothetical protein
MYWPFLELDVVRFAALEKTHSYGLEKLSESGTRHAFILELPQSQGAWNATPQKPSVHGKTAVPCLLGRPALFLRDADR